MIKREMIKILLVYFCVVVHHTAEANSSSVESESKIGHDRYRYFGYAFPFSIGDKHYFYEQGEMFGDWTIRELLDGGKLGGKIEYKADGFRSRSHFPFSIDGEHYLFGISEEDFLCYIQRVHKNGKLEPIMYTDYEPCKDRYLTAQFPFSINGKLYYHARTFTNWFTYELKSGGKFGSLRDDGEADNGPELGNSCFPFSVNGSQYFYCQHLSEEKEWVIRELLPGGYMGDITDRNRWNYYYYVQFPFSVGGRQYFYGYQDRTGAWFIRELLSGGRMGRQVDNGHWKRYYLVQFPFSIGERQFFYAKNTAAGSWFIREILQTGKMGNETDSDNWNYGS